jgi:hypothetical protein
MTDLAWWNALLKFRLNSFRPAFRPVLKFGEIGPSGSESKVTGDTVYKCVIAVTNDLRISVVWASSQIFALGMYCNLLLSRDQLGHILRSSPPSPNYRVSTYYEVPSLTLCCCRTDHNNKVCFEIFQEFLQPSMTSCFLFIHKFHITVEEFNFPELRVYLALFMLMATIHFVPLTCNIAIGSGAWSFCTSQFGPLDNSSNLIIFIHDQTSEPSADTWMTYISPYKLVSNGFEKNILWLSWMHLMKVTLATYLLTKFIVGVFKTWSFPQTCTNISEEFQDWWH